MKTHSSNYKYEIKEFGRQITSKITYGNVELGEDDLNSITPSFESSILKSAMKRLEIDSNVEIPLETEINYQFGCLVGNEYEYIDFGNYIVYSSEKHEDTNSYYIIAYDKMLYAMKDYEDLGITYPITIRNYINAICTKLGLTFANASDTFANYDKEIQHELYLNADGESIGYTYRDVLDELAQVTASTICINDDELEIRYINDTNDTIDEEYLRDVNVSFGEKYGPVNSIVLARAESDKIYLKDYESVEENGLCEIMINDNQIMNGQDRNTYLPDILEELDGLEYYLNDFTSTGITYYDICDRYNIQIGENTYSCIMFNDSIEVTQGLNETIFTDRLEESETDYKKADKEDRKINQTRIVVDKHNQEISTLISYVGDRSDKQTSLTQDVDGLIAQVQNIPTITTEGSGYGSVTLTELANTKIAMIKVHPTNNIDIIRNVASPHLKVRIGNKVGHRGLKFIQEEESELKLPRNLFFYDSETYDEFVLDGLEERMYVIHRVGFQNGVKVMLDTPIIEEFEYQDIIIDEGTLTITYNDYPSAYIYLKAMIKNDYTETFATKLEMNSKIEQTAQEINLEVAKKVDNDEIISKINQSAEQISIEANKINLNGVVSANGNFKIDTNGVMEAIGCRLGGYIAGQNIQMDLVSGSLETSDRYLTSIMADEIVMNGPAKEGETFPKGTLFIQPGYFNLRNNVNWGTQQIEQFYGIEFFRDTFTIDGNLVVTGEKNRIVETKDGYVKLNAYETTTPYFADIGSGKLDEKGECKITIDKQFAQTIEEDTYKVFVQKLGKGDIWIEKYKNYFIVKGEPNLEFDYEIKAIQKGYANTRLEKFERSDEHGISKNNLAK